MDSRVALPYHEGMPIALAIIPRESVEELRSILTHLRDEGQRKRLRAIIRIKEGIPHGKVAADLGASRTSLCAWIAKYNDGGVDQLATNAGGRPEGNPKWDSSIFDDLAKEIDKGGYWSIPRMQEWLTTHKGKDVPEQTVWYRMDQLNYSYKGARPHPMQGNKEKQAQFKKGASFRSWSR